MNQLLRKIGFFPILLLFCLFLTGCTAENSPEKTISSLEELTSLEDILEAKQLDVTEYFGDVVLSYKIRYKSDDCEVVGYVSAPADYREKEYPVVIYNRGGNREFGKLDDYNSAGAAAGGYIVLASQYRGVDGGTGTEEFGGKDVDDVRKLIDISESFAFRQKGGVYMIGMSRGGMMTYLACREDDRIKAAVVASADSNAAMSYYEREDAMKQVLIDLIGGTPEELPEEYEKRSAVMWAEEIDVPLLILHGGEADWRVLTHHATDMAAALEKAGKEHKLIIYEDADHSLSGTNSNDEVFDWFKTHPLNP